MKNKLLVLSRFWNHDFCIDFIFPEAIKQYSSVLLCPIDYEIESGCDVKSVTFPPLVKKEYSEKERKRFDSFCLFCEKNYFVTIDHLVKMERFDFYEKKDEFSRYFFHFFDEIIDADTTLVSFTNDHFVLWMASLVAVWKKALSYIFVGTGVPFGYSIVFRALCEKVKCSSELNKKRLFTEMEVKLNSPTSQRYFYMAKKSLRLVKSKRLITFKDNNNFSKYLFPSKQTIFKRISSFSRAILIDRFFGILQFKPLKNKKYVFYPLHLEPEATVCLYGIYGAHNQYNNIAVILKNLAMDEILLVKENPKSKLGKSFKLFLFCLFNKNVKFIPPFYDTTNLVKEASKVFSISGSVLYEAHCAGTEAASFGFVPFGSLCTLNYHYRDIILKNYIEREFLLSDSSLVVDKLVNMLDVDGGFFHGEINPLVLEGSDSTSLMKLAQRILIFLKQDDAATLEFKDQH